MAAPTTIHSRLNNAQSVEHLQDALQHPTSNSTTTKTTSASSNAASSLSPRPQPGGSDNDNVDKAKRKRQPRNSACQSCAALKMKCIATSTPGICERCCRMNRECVPAIPKPRKRRATDSFEPKGVPLAELIDRGSPRIETYRPLPRTHVAESNNSDTRTRSSPGRTDFNGSSFSRSFARSLGLYDRAADYLLHGIDQSYVKQCFDNFSHMVKHFPFVSVPAAGPGMMVATLPVTSAAICTVASASQPEIQARLSEAFRQALASKCILEGERSIDLMTGLMIYVAWHHQYYKKQQIYQMLCLLAGMATDLGLQNTPTLSEQSRGLPDSGTQRTFVGVYYLTASLSLMGFNKPCPLTWSPSLDHFASTLYSISREINLQPYIDLAHLLEDHAKLVAAAPPVQAASYIDLATQSALSRLNTLKRIHHTAATIPAYAAATVHINAGALTASASLDLPGSALMQTAAAIKEYLDTTLARPALALHHIAVVDWTNLLETLVLSTRLTSSHFCSSLAHLAGSSLGWETSSLAAMLRPEVVLNSVCTHMASAPSDGCQGTRHEGLLSWLKGLCASMKTQTTYERNGHDESAFDAVSSLDRAVKQGSVGAEESRFRAVNTSPGSSTPFAQRPPPAPWSPRGVSDFTFSLFGGKGLLDESYWIAFGDWDSR